MISIRADRAVPYRFIDAVRDQLRVAGAVRVCFHTDIEARVRRQSEVGEEDSSSVSP
jgi:hypothetical protein